MRSVFVSFLIAIASVANAQSLPLLTRSTAIAGLNDSALTLVSDSAQRTRAATTHELFKRPLGTAAKPSFSFGLDSTKGMFGLTSDTLAFATSGATSLRISGGASSMIVGGAGNMILQAGTGASRSFALRVTDAGSTSFTCLSLSTVQLFLSNSGCSGLLRAGNGTAGAPSLSFGGDDDNGMYLFGADTVGIATGGAASLRIRGGASPTIFGGAGDMTIQAGTGNSRNLTLQTTTSGGVATTAVRYNPVQQSLMPSGAITRPAYSFSGDTLSGMSLNGTADIAFFTNNGNPWRLTTARIRAPGSSTGAFMAGSGSNTFPGFTFVGDSTKGIYGHNTDTIGISTSGTKRLLIANQGATAAGDVALCVKTTGVTGVITQGATCGSSTAKLKTNIRPLTASSAVAKTMALRPSSFAYIAGVYGGRKEYGLIAEEVAKVDSTLVYRAAALDKLPNGQVIKPGDPFNVNDRAVLAILIATVQQQQKTIDSLVTALGKGKP